MEISGKGQAGGAISRIGWGRIVNPPPSKIQGFFLMTKNSLGKADAKRLASI
jgi:hypothetical protein